MDRSEKQFQETIIAFNNGNFSSAILSFITLHQQGYRQEEILQILDKACYLPNEEEMWENYQLNLEMLRPG